MSSLGSIHAALTVMSALFKFRLGLARSPDGLSRGYCNPHGRPLRNSLKYVQRETWALMHRLYCARQENEHFYFRVEVSFHEVRDGCSQCFADDNLLSWHEDILAFLPDQVPARILVRVYLSTPQQYALVKDLIVPRVNK